MFPHENAVCTFPRIRATCPSHLILDLITGIIFREEYSHEEVLILYLSIPLFRRPAEAQVSSVKLCVTICIRETAAFGEIFLSVECEMSRRSYEIFVLLFVGLIDNYRNFGVNIMNCMGVRQKHRVSSFTIFVRI